MDQAGFRESAERVVRRNGHWPRVPADVQVSAMQLADRPVEARHSEVVSADQQPLIALLLDEIERLTVEVRRLRRWSEPLS